MSPQIRAFHGIVFLSGFAGLGYEMVWTRMLSAGLGHEIVSVLAVVAAFFCGMALGSWTLGRVSSACTGIRSASRWYAGAEAAIGCWSLALIPLIPWANRAVAQWMGPEPSPLHQWSLSFFVPLALLLPATFAMGGTLPLMNRIHRGLRASRSPIGGLYAANTFGAVAGTLLSTFLIVPALGFRATLISFAAINFLCAGGTLIGTRNTITEPEPVPKLHPAARPSYRLAATLFFTGFLGIGFEVVVVRAMSQALENTVYSFAGILSIYLLGTAFGAAMYQKLYGSKPFDEALSELLTVLAGVSLLGTILLSQSSVIYHTARSLAGKGFSASVLGELALAMVVLLCPTMAMGATFAHLAQKSDAESSWFGGALCVNTLGASLAPLAFGIVLMPLWGGKTVLILISLGYLTLIPLLAGWHHKPLLVPLLAGIILLSSPFSLNLISLEPGDTILEHRDGVMASVTILKDRQNEIHLKINNRFQMGGTSSVFSDRREGHIPLLLHPEPRTALFLGMGTGGTLAAAADHPGLKAVGVELVPEVLPLLHHFERSTGPLSRHPHLRLVAADARRYVNCSPEKYDVIVADLFHPARDGAGSLYTREHFEAIASRLNFGGVFCQWLPLYQMDLEVLRIIVKTFLEVFPDGSAFLAHYSLKAPIVALVSGVRAGGYPPDWWDERARDPELRERLERLRLDSLYSLLGCFLASSDDLRRFAGDALLNTEDRPVVTFQAPLFAYGVQEPATGRLLTLLDRFKPQPEQVLESGQRQEDRDTHRRLASYWNARNRFIHAGVGVPETGDVRMVLQNTRDNLLEVIRTSPDFTAAYLPLLTMAQRLYSVDPSETKSLLLDLEKANPHRTEARTIRRKLFAE